MARKQRFTCQNCGTQYSKWVGQCTVCKEWNTIEEDQDVAIAKDVLDLSQKKVVSKSLYELSGDVSDKRIQTGFEELDRVLGGGVVNDEVILISGDPGIGKSTLLLQVTANIANKYNCLYVSGEESFSQVAGRAKRILKKDANLKILSSSSLSNIVTEVIKHETAFVVIDSIQTIYDEETEGLPGSQSQIKKCTAKLINLAKNNKIALLLVGHITKTGNIAGPKLLEHLVDCVLQFEGTTEHQYRVLRSLKNRFGNTGEVGVFQMKEDGLTDLNDSNGIFEIQAPLSEGIAKVPVKEGKRTFFVDIQALVSKTVFSYPKRVSEGVSNSKLQILSAILEKQKIVNAYEKDLYLKTTGGYQIRNTPYADLGIAAAFISSDKGKVFKHKFVFIGELGLNGNVMLQDSLHSVVSEAQKIFSDYFVVAPVSKGKSNNKSLVYINHVSKILDLLD